MEDLDKIDRAVPNYIKANSLCGLGQTAPNPVLSTLRYFRDEYVEHIVEQALPGGRVQGAAELQDRPRQVQGLHAVRAHLPGRRHQRHRASQPHTIDTAKCVKCGACIEKCKFGAISKGVREGVTTNGNRKHQNQRRALRSRCRALPSWKPPTAWASRSRPCAI